MPPNITATTSLAEAIQGAQYAVHAVPVQHSRAFLHSIKARSRRTTMPPLCSHLQLHQHQHQHRMESSCTG